MKKAAVVLLLMSAILVSFQSVDAQNDFFDHVIEREGENVTLDCNHTTVDYIIPNNSMPVSWMLPDLRIITGDSEKYIISSDKWTMTVVDARRTEFGLYHCMLLTEDAQWYLVRLGLNAEGPYFEDLWAKYDMNTYIALGAAGGFLLITALLVIVYTFRYITPEERQKNERRDDASSVSSRSSEVRKRHVGANVSTDVEGVEKGKTKEFEENGVAVITSYDNDAFKSDDHHSRRSSDHSNRGRRSSSPSSDGETSF